MSFQELSREIAQDFLQTVVVVDDHAYLHFNDDESSEKPEIVLDPLLAVSSDSEEKLEDDPVQEGNHPLNAKVLIDKFAEKGLVCAVLRAEKTEDKVVIDKAVNAAKRSDLIILDWKIHTYGDITKKIIEKIITSDKESNRLRFIAIYTGQNNLIGYIKEVEESLKAAGLQVFLSQDGLSLQCNAAFITIFVKNQKDVDPSKFEEYLDRLVAVEDLPDKLVDEFSQVSYGLIPSVALESLSAIRNSTHTLLGKFNAQLDAPFLAHRVLLDNPEESISHLNTLIAEELNAIIHDYEVGKNVLDETKIIDWAHENGVIKNNLLAKLQDTDNFKKLITLGLTQEEVKNIDSKLRGCAATQFNETSKLFVGNNELFKAIESKKQEVEDAKAKRKVAEAAERENHSAITTENRKRTAKDCSTLEKQLNLMSKDYDREIALIEEGDHNFATIMSMLSYYKNPIPYLRLGVIIKEVEKDEYYLCLQPRCDSVHITTAERSFPFVPLKVEENISSFDIAIKDGGQVKYGSITLEPYACRMLEFSPNGPNMKVVPAGDLMFSTIDDKKYLFIGELKPNFAQDIVNRYAAKVSRVGLNKSEWHRRWNK